MCVCVCVCVCVLRTELQGVKYHFLSAAFRGKTPDERVADVDGCQVCVCESHCNMSLIQSGNIRYLNVKESHQCFWSFIRFLQTL